MRHCRSSCASLALSDPSPGWFNHLRWPVSRDDTMFQFLREHPLL